MNDNLEQCDCCDYFTILCAGDYEICPVCFWEQDSYGFGEPDERSGANHGLTLRQARRNFENVGVCAEPFGANVIPEQARQKFRRNVRHLSADGVCIVDCVNVHDESEFWDAYVDAARPQGADVFGKNLDAFWDAIYGGPGFTDAHAIYFINTFQVRGINSGRFYAALTRIVEDSGASIFIE